MGADRADLSDGGETRKGGRDPVGQLAEEFVERHRRGENPSVGDYVRRHPELEREIREVFSALVFMEGIANSITDLPVTCSAALGGVELAGGAPVRLGEYRIVRELGRGGMGVVYEAEQEALGRRVALKVLPFHVLLGERSLRRFQREARAAAALQHPGIVAIHDTGNDRGIHYYVMELVRGRGLDHVLGEIQRRSGTMAGESSPVGEMDESAGSAAGSPGDGGGSSSLLTVAADDSSRGASRYFGAVARVGVQVAQALGYAHTQGVVHRDIKPSNILLDDSGNVWVTDFGLAKAQGSDDLTLSGEILGTPRYMPPEALRGWSDPRSDIYSLGATLYELATLKPAFDDHDRARLIRRISEEEPKRPRQVAPAVPVDLETVVLKAMAKEPAERYQSAAELAADLESFLAGRPVSARRASAWEKGVKWVRRHPVPAALGAGILLLVAILLAASLWYNVRIRESETVARERLDEVLRLSDVKRLQDYLAEAEDLWPCVPGKAEEMRAWLEKAENLAARLDLHRATLDVLRARALPDDRGQRRTSHPDAAQLESLLARRDAEEREVKKLEVTLGTEARATVLSPSRDPGDLPVTCRLRHAFDFQQGGRPERLLLRLTIDDGAVVYLNGEEAMRTGEPGAEVSLARAAVSVDRPAAAVRELPADALVWGRNLVAVEVHQTSGVLADLFFDLDLRAGEKVLIGPGSHWRYREAPDEPSAAWKELRFDDSAWPEGPAPLGYGFVTGPGRLLELREALGNLQERIEKLEQKVRERRAWSFGETELQWQHDTLQGLVADLERFRDPKRGAIASVKKRLDFASAVRKRTIDDHAARWDQARASIANRQECPLYGGLGIRPQVGLVPLGRDPRSGLWEFALLQTGEPPGRDADGKLMLREETALVLVLLPGGTFRMGATRPTNETVEGSPHVDPQAMPDEVPVHEVTLAPFFISKYEMTQGQWLRFTGENPSYFAPGSRYCESLLHPAEQLSWEMCDRTLRQLGLVLPTEAQWEYACRAGTTSVWWSGDLRESLEGRANLADRSAAREGARWPGLGDWLDDEYPLHAPVGTFEPNPFGLHEICGNLHEWCRDWYADYKLPVREGDGERLVTPGNGKLRVSRDGGYNTAAMAMRSAARNADSPDFRNSSVGVRPARRLDE